MLAVSMMSTGVSEETRGEADPPAEQSQTCQTAWFPGPYAHSRRSGNHPHASPKGSHAAVRMIDRVRNRAAFTALERRRHRVLRGPVSVAYVADAPPDLAGSARRPARVAFGVGRRVGSAVTRNKVRRRLRHIMRELDDQPDGLAPGSYLVAVRPDAAQLPYAELRRRVADACGAVRADRQQLAGTRR